MPLPGHSRPLGALLSLCATLVIGCGGPRSAAPPAAREVRVPNPDIGADALAARKTAQLATADQFSVFYQFQFTDRVRESGITFVHHIVDDAGKQYKAVHYDHGNGIAVADVDGDGLYDIYFVNQVGGNELWKNLGGGRFRDITKESGVGLAGRISVAASFADIDNDGDQDLFVTTVRGGNVLFENDGHGHFKDISKEAGVDLVTHSSGAVFFDFDRDGLVDLLVCNVGQYTTDQKGPDGAYVGLADAFLGHTHPDRFEYPVLYRNTGRNLFKDVTADRRIAAVRLGRGCERGRSERRRLAGSLRAEHAGARALLREPGRAHVRRQDRRVLPQNALGRDGDQVLRLRQRRPPGSLHHRHALGHVRDHAAGPRKAEGRRASARAAAGRACRHVHLRQRPLPQHFEARRNGVRGDLRPRRRRELLAVGSERRGRERGRLGGHLHRVEHGLPAPIRDQLDALEQPRREVPGCRVPARHRAAHRRPDAHAVVRARLPDGRAGCRISAAASRGRSG